MYASEKWLEEGVINRYKINNIKQDIWGLQATLDHAENGTPAERAKVKAKIAALKKKMVQLQAQGK